MTLPTVAGCYRLGVQLGTGGPIYYGTVASSSKIVYFQGTDATQATSFYFVPNHMGSTNVMFQPTRPLHALTDDQLNASEQPFLSAANNLLIVDNLNTALNWATDTTGTVYAWYPDGRGNKVTGYPQYGYGGTLIFVPTKTSQTLLFEPAESALCRNSTGSYYNHAFQAIPVSDPVYSVCQGTTGTNACFYNRLPLSNATTAKPNLPFTNPNNWVGVPSLLAGGAGGSGSATQLVHTESKANTWNWQQPNPQWTIAPLSHLTNQPMALHTPVLRDTVQTAYLTEPNDAAFSNNVQVSNHADSQCQDPGQSPETCAKSSDSYCHCGPNSDICGLSCGTGLKPFRYGQCSENPAAPGTYTQAWVCAPSAILGYVDPDTGRKVCAEKTEITVKQGATVFTNFQDCYEQYADCPDGYERRNNWNGGHSGCWRKGDYLQDWGSQPLHCACGSPTNNCVNDSNKNSGWQSYCHGNSPACHNDCVDTLAVPPFGFVCNATLSQWQQCTNPLGCAPLTDLNGAFNIDYNDHFCTESTTVSSTPLTQ